jgi:hypothetical protein
VGKPAGKRPLRRPSDRWMDNVKVDLRMIGWGGMDLIGLACSRYRWRVLVTMVKNLRVP